MKVNQLIESGIFCCNEEIAEQYGHIDGSVGSCLKACLGAMLYEVGQDHWDWRGYLSHVERMTASYYEYVSEYNGNRKNTIDLDDLSIVALAKTLRLPIVSMEGLDNGQISAKRMRIPRLCDCEEVPHLTFNELLRKEGACI